MCEFNSKNDSRFRDPCMIKLIHNFDYILSKIKKEDGRYKLLASCCGHGKYSPSLIVQWGIEGYNVELFSGKTIERKKKFYKKDKQGHYYLPEVSKEC